MHIDEINWESYAKLFPNKFLNVHAHITVGADLSQPTANLLACPVAHLSMIGTANELAVGCDNAH